MRAQLSGFRPLVCMFAVMLSTWGQSAELTMDILDDHSEPLANAVVALVPEQKPDFSEPLGATMDQRGVKFSPKVLAVRTNTQVEFLNNDPIFHHVYSFSPAKRFELGLKKGERSEPVLFDQPGEVVLGCKIHDGMLAYIYVLDTEWFGVTGRNGRVKLTEIPTGEYELVVRHPRLEEPVGEVLDLSSDAKVRRRFMLPELEPDPFSSASASASEQESDGVQRLLTR